MNSSEILKMDLIDAINEILDEISTDCFWILLAKGMDISLLEIQTNK